MTAFDKAWAFLKSETNDKPLSSLERHQIAEEEAFERYLDEKERQAYKDGKMTDEELQLFLDSNTKWRKPPKSKEVKTG